MVHTSTHPITSPPLAGPPPPVLFPLDGATKRTESSTKELLSKFSIFGLRARRSTDMASIPTVSSRPIIRHARSFSEPSTPPASPAQLEMLQYRDQHPRRPLPNSSFITPPVTTVPLPPTTPGNSHSIGKSGGFLRGLKHHGSISALRRKRSKTKEHMSPTGKSGSPSKYSLNATPPRSLLSIRIRKKSSSKSLKRMAQQPEHPQPVPPLPEQYRRQNVQSHIALQGLAGSRNTVIYDDHDQDPVRGSTDSVPASVHSLRPPPPTRCTPYTTPRTLALPAEVALEFGTTPSPRSARVLDSSGSKQHRRTQSADDRPHSGMFSSRCDTHRTSTNDTECVDTPRAHRYQTFADFSFPVEGTAVPLGRTPPRLPHAEFDEVEQKQEIRPFPTISSVDHASFHASFDSFERMFQATPKKGMLTPGIQEAAEPESTIFPNISEAEHTQKTLDHSHSTHESPLPRTWSPELDTSQANSSSSIYSDRSRQWSPERGNIRIGEWATEATFDEDDFEPVDGSFGGHENPYAGKSLSTILEADSTTISYPYSNSTVMLRHSRTGSSPAPDAAQTFMQPRRATPVNETIALLEAQKAETSALKNELEACQLVVKHLQAERERSVDLAEERDEKLRKLTVKVGELEDALDDARMALTASEETVNQLQDTNDQLLGEHRTSQQQRESTANISVGSPARVADMEREHAQALENLRTELEKEHAAAMADLRSQLAERQTQLQQTNFQASDSELQMSSLNQRFEEAKFEASEAKNACVALEAERDELEALVEKLRLENDSLADDLEQAADDRDAVMDERDRALDERAEALNLLDELRLKMDEEEDRSTDEKLAFSREMNAVRRNERDMASEIRSLLDGHQELADKHQTLRDKYEETSKECVEWRQRAWHTEEVTVKRLEDRIATLTDLLQAANSRNDAEEDELANRSTTTLVLQEQELVGMREELSLVKEELSETKQLLAKRVRDSEREISQLREELQDHQEHYINMKDDLRKALEGQEYHRGKAADHWSRSQTYLNEVESLKIREAELRAKISALEAQSSRDSLAHSELTRRLASVMQDRDMLSNALDSKDFELELLRRGHQSRKRVSQLSPSPKDNIKLRVKTSPKDTPEDTPLQTPTALAPTGKHNASTQSSIASFRLPKSTGDRPLMTRQPLKDSRRSTQSIRSATPVDRSARDTPIKETAPTTTTTTTTAHDSHPSLSPCGEPPSPPTQLAAIGGSRNSRASNSNSMMTRSALESASSRGTLAGRFQTMGLDKA